MAIPKKPDATEATAEPQLAPNLPPPLMSPPAPLPELPELPVRDWQIDPAPSQNAGMHRG